MITGGLDEVGDAARFQKTCHSRFIVYGLFDPTSGLLRYIGKSTSGLKRAKNHTKNSDLRRHGRTHKTAWILSLRKNGLVPIHRVLLECRSADELYEEEQELIKYFRSKGADLVNATDGGPGRIGYRLSDETKEKLRRATTEQQKRCPTRHGTEVRERLRLLQQGRVHTEETRRNMAKAHGAMNFMETTSGVGFESLSDAARHFAVSASAVGRVLRGERESIHGLRFTYV